MKNLVLALTMAFTSLSMFAQTYGWSALGTGANALNANGSFWSICSDLTATGNIYAAGDFTDINGFHFVAKWDGTSWSELGLGSNALNANHMINSICIDAIGNIYAAGGFTNVNNKFYVAKWNGISWSELGTGSNALNANNAIYSICVDASGNLFAGGWFTNTSGKRYVAKWNGTSWSELGSGSNALNANNYIMSICLGFSGNVYAAGLFTNANGYCYVARWNGNNWAEVGSGSNALNPNNWILTICGDLSGNLFAGGWFTNASGKRYVAKWNGINWSELGTGTNALNANNNIICTCLDVSGNVYAAGIFTNSNNKWYVAKWNGITWNELGTGSNALNADNAINTICLDTPGNVYTAGLFGNSNNYCYVAIYSGCSVSPAGPITGPTQVCQGSNGYVYTIAPVPNATGYTWSLPSGGTITSGAGTNIITVSYGLNAVSGTVSVYGTGNCNGASSQLQVTVNAVPNPTITGSNNLCVNSGYYNYSTETGMSSYQWSVSSGGNITFGQGSNVVQVVWNQAGNQWIAVNYMNSGGCMALVPAIFSVMVNPLPNPAGAITGSSIVCAGSGGIYYSVAPIGNAATYVWITPAGATVTSGIGTNAITVDFADTAASGDITVYGNNLCGNGAPSPNFFITVNPIPVTPTITENGDTLFSNAPIGNQWYYNGILLANDTNQTYVVSPYLPGYYWTHVTLYGCVSDTSNHIYCSHVGLTEKNQERISIYPVPNDGQFTISVYSRTAATCTISIYNNLGFKIYGDICKTLQTFTFINIDLRPVSTGIYTIVLHNSNSQIIKKFLIQ